MPAGLVRVLDLPEELGDIRRDHRRPGRLGLGGHDPGGVGAGGQADHPAGPLGVPDTRERRHDVGLAGAGGGYQAVNEPVRSEQAEAGLALGRIEVGTLQRGGRVLGSDPPRNRDPRGVHQVLLVVPVLRRAEPLLPRRPVDRRAVAGAQAEPGHVDRVRSRSDLQHVHALSPARDRLGHEPV